MSNVELAESKELLGPDIALVVDLVGQLPLLMHLPLHHIKQISHLLIALDDVLILLDQPLDPLEHEGLELFRSHGAKDGMLLEHIGRRKLFSSVALVFNFVDVILYSDAHLEVK